MSDVRNNGFGDYFGSYSSGSGPRNLTSDMWAPISTDNNFVANTGARPRPSSSEGAARQTGNAPAQGRKQEPVPESKPPQKKKEKGKKKSRSIIGDAVGAKMQHDVKPHKSDNKAADKKTRSKEKSIPAAKTQPISKKKNQKYINKLKKDKLRYISLIKKGKSIDEARRIMSERKVRKRKLSTLFSVLTAFVFAFCICFTYCYYEGAPIKEIIVKGDKVYSRQEIVSAAGVFPGQSMLTVRESDINEKVLTKLPFISSISLNYVFPEVLEMDIVSTREHFIIKSGNKYACVDKNGKIVSLKKKKVEKDQFLVIGPNFAELTLGTKFEPLQTEIHDGLTTEQKLLAEERNALEMKKYNAMIEVSSLCEKYGIITGGKLDVSNLSDIKIDYESRIRIYLGDLKNLELKIDNAGRILAQQVEKGQTGYIDVSYDVRNFFMAGSMER